MSLLSIIAAGCSVLGLAGSAYFVLSTWAAVSYRNEVRSESSPAASPPVSILKSLKGIDPHMYEAFVSHCTVDYPEYEVLFGVADLQEPALEVVRKLQQEFPQIRLRVIHCPETLGFNGKVSNLAQTLPQASYEHVIINDSDIVVPRDYLRKVMSPFSDPAVGMVTTLYRGVSGNTLGSKLEALGICTDFAGGVLLARAMEGGIRFGLGATIATTKTLLEKIGGLEQLTDVLGDDYELGARAAKAGFNVTLADTVLQTTLPDYTFHDFWLHQLRWARNVKDRRPGQYFGLIATFGLAWAILGVIVIAVRLVDMGDPGGHGNGSLYRCNRRRVRSVEGYPRPAESLADSGAGFHRPGDMVCELLGQYRRMARHTLSPPRWQAAANKMIEE